MAKVETITLKVDAETRAAEKALKTLEKSLDNLDDAKISVKADTKSAEKSIKNLSRDLEDLDDTEFDVKAETRDAERSIDDLLDSVDKLDSEQAIIELKLEEANLEGQLADIMADVDKLDSQDATIELKLDEATDIGGDLDKIDAKVREIDDLKAEVTITADSSQVGRGVTTARQETDKLTDSANKARNASANMWGNAAQDLGAFTGIAGSAGVALGQLAEGAADARNNSEGFRSILKGIGGAVAPIAALSVGLFAIDKAMGRIAKNKALDAERVADWADAIGEGGDNLDIVIRRFEEAQSIFTRPQSGDAFGFSDMVFGGDDPLDIIEQLNSVGITAEEVAQTFGRVFDEGIRGEEEFRTAILPIIQSLAATGLEGEELQEVVEALWGEFDTFATKLDQTNKNAGFFAITAAEAQRALDGLKDPLETLPGAWERLIEMVGTGNIENQAAVLTIRELAAATGLTEEAVIALAKQEFGKGMAEDAAKVTAALEDQVTMWESIKQAEEEAAAEVERFVDAVTELTLEPLDSDKFADLVADVKDGTIDLANFEEGVQDLAGAWGISTEAVRQYILEEADKQIDAEKTAMEEAAEAAKELAAAIPEITEAISDINVDDIDNIARGFEEALDATGSFIDHLVFAENLQHEFDDALGEARRFGPDLRELLDLMAAGVTITPDITLGELESDDAEFLQWVQGLQTMVREGAVEAFTTGGADAANAFVQAQADAFLAANPELTLADFYRLMGLPPDGSIDTFIKMQVDAEAKADALAILDTLMGVDPNNPILAYIKLQVQTGAIDPVIAEIVALLLAQQLGVDVTPQLAEFTPEQIAQAQTQIDAAGGVTVPANADTTAIPGQVETAADGTVVTVPTDADNTGATNTINELTGLSPVAYVYVIAETADAEDAIEGLSTGDDGGPRQANITVTADNAGQIGGILDAVAAEERAANYVVTADNAGAIGGILDAVAMPTEDGRIAPFFAQVSPASTAAEELDDIANPQPRRTAWLYAGAKDLVKIGDAIDDVADKRRTADINVKADDAGAVDKILDDVADDRVAHILPLAIGTQNTDATINNVARDRTADITAVAHTGSAANELNELDNDRYANIFIRVQGASSARRVIESVASSGTRAAPAGATSPVPAGAMLSSAPAATPASSTTIVVPAPNVIAPNVTIKTAVIGSRYDVMRVVTAATRNGVRLGARSLKR